MFVACVVCMCLCRSFHPSLDPSLLFPRRRSNWADAIGQPDTSLFRALSSKSLCFADIRRRSIFIFVVDSHFLPLFFSSSLPSFFSRSSHSLLDSSLSAFLFPSSSFSLSFLLLLSLPLFLSLSVSLLRSSSRSTHSLIHSQNHSLPHA